MNTHSCCNLSYEVYANAYHEPALPSIINRCTHRALRNKDILKCCPNCFNKTVHQAFNSRKGEHNGGNDWGTPPFAVLWSTGLPHLERRINSEGFIFSLFDTLSSTWGVLEEPAQHVATDNSRLPKPLVKMPDNLESHAEETQLLADKRASTFHCHIPHPTTHPNSSQNKWLGKTSNSVEKDTGKQERGRSCGTCRE